MVESKVVSIEQDGGCQTDEEEDDESSWKTVVNNTLHTSYELQNLTSDVLYRFRVSAINKAGVSDPVILNG